eukprot:2238658-Rhodomonas_salina.2
MSAAPLSAYAAAMRCPVLTWRMARPGLLCAGPLDHGQRCTLPEVLCRFTARSEVLHFAFLVLGWNGRIVRLCQLQRFAFLALICNGRRDVCHAGPSYDQGALVPAYARPTQCSVLTQRMVISAFLRDDRY